MTETCTKLSDRLPAIRQWVVENKSRYDHHPYYADLIARLESIEQLDQASFSQREDGTPVEPTHNPIISLSSMKRTVQLDRCEVLIDMLQRSEAPGKKRRVEQILYPSIRTALLQQIIQWIVWGKNRIGISTKTYSASGFVQLSYIKSPPGLTKIISRFLPRIW